jgi:hypothetical protein
MTQEVRHRRIELIELSREPALRVAEGTQVPGVVANLAAGEKGSVWATQREVANMIAWLREHGLHEERQAIHHWLDAEWRFPESPLVKLSLDGESVATVDYLPGSASAHWSLRWSRAFAGIPASSVIALVGLVEQVPEEADAELVLWSAVIDTALSAVVAQITKREVDIE